MITSFELYMLSVIGNLDILLNIAFFLFILLAIFIGVAGFCLEEKRETYFGTVKTILIWTFIISIPMVLIPSRKDLIVIYTVPAVLQNEKIQKLPDVLLDYIIKEFTIEKSK